MSNIAKSQIHNIIQSQNTGGNVQNDNQFGPSYHTYEQPNQEINRIQSQAKQIQLSQYTQPIQQHVQRFVQQNCQIPQYPKRPNNIQSLPSQQGKYPVNQKQKVDNTKEEQNKEVVIPIEDKQQSQKDSMLISFISNLVNRLTSTITSFGSFLGNLNDRWADHLVTLNVYKYIDIDSSYRNRSLYPLSSDFVVPFTNSSQGSNAFTALDPVSNAIAYDEGLTTVGSTLSEIYLANTSSSIINFYVNSILEIQGSYANIKSYNPVNKSVMIQPTLSIAPPVNTPYKIRKGIPIFTGTLQAGNTNTSVVLPNNASNDDNAYVGTFIVFDSGVCHGISRIITAYDGLTKVAILSSTLNDIPGQDMFEIDAFSYDNAMPLRYNGSKTIAQPTCYLFQLISLSIPNLPLLCGYGGRIDNYPYIYVHFYNDNNHSDITMYGNNQSAYYATFKVPIDKNVNVTPNFIIINSVALTAQQAVKFTLGESIRCKYTLPNGENLVFATDDNYSPLAPNPFVQISMCVGLSLVKTFPKVKNVA